MSLWGNKDDKGANTGTISIAANGLVTGSSTLLNTEGAVGDYIVANNTKYRVVSITSNTVAQVAAQVLGGTIATVSSNTFIFQEAPVYVSAASVDSSANDVFGIDTTEQGVSNGSVVSYTTTFAGSGYSANATVTVGGNATANGLNTGGRISVLAVLAGNSYATSPSVTVAAPTAQSFNANSAVTNATDAIAFTTANSIFLAGDRVTYTVATGNTALTNLTSGTQYYIKTANSTAVTLSATLGGDTIDLTKGVTETGHSLTGETATAVAAISGLSGRGSHAGWVKRTVGTGGRAGRVQYETLVAMGSISGDAEDTIAKDS